jgi:hypothetical protein
VVAALATMQAEGVVININAVCHAARVSKTFLYDPKHADLAEQIRSLRQANPKHRSNGSTNPTKSDAAKDAQIIRFKERISTLEDQVRTLREVNELLYGKLSEKDHFSLH